VPTSEVKQRYVTTKFSNRSKKSIQPSQCLLSTSKIIFSNFVQIKSVYTFFVNMRIHQNVIKPWLQGPSLLKNFAGDNPYCLRFDDVTMFTQP